MEPVAENEVSSGVFPAISYSGGYMDLHEKAARLGVETSFVDATGICRTVSAEAVALIVQSLPDRPRLRIFSGPLVCYGGGDIPQAFAASANPPIIWKVIDLRGDQKACGISQDQLLALQELPFGIYRLQARDAIGDEEVSLVSAPKRAFAGHFDRVWILAVQLYGVRSSRNWGIGDFADLTTLIKWAATYGAAGIGLNPLHALFDNHPQECSPYSPNSRLFLNSLYLDVEQVPELPRAFVIDHADEIDRLRSAEFVDYQNVAKLKLKALRQAFDSFQAKATPTRRKSFETYRQREGELLSRYACFEVLRRKYGGPWWTWSQEWSSPGEAALSVLRNGPDRPEIEFIEFIQWNADQQLAACRDMAQQSGMLVGLYLDIAVGVKADGFDAWNEQAAISRKLGVGAPPDILNTAGQNWGLAGFNAAGLELRSYQPFMELLNASMRYAGAVRLDHVLGLRRLYLVPEGYSPHQGAYVEMPTEILLAVAALTSVVNSCVIIGEDLGTVPDGFRERLASWGIWSYRVMMFERGHDGSFHSPNAYAQDALVTFNTHDLPTFLGWTSAHDIALKQALGIDPGEDHQGRAHAVNMLAAAVGHAQLPELNFYSVISYLARTRSRILALSIEDLLKVQDQPNVPGTVDEHPNWRRRLPINIEHWESEIDVDLMRTAADRYHDNS